MPSQSKAKGNSWEREICEHLSKIYNVNFQRVPTSGAYLGLSNSTRLQKMTPEQILLASGDIIVPNFLSHISIEAKFYKSFSFESLFTENKQLNKWIEQASMSSKIPLIMFKINHKGSFMVFPYEYKDSLKIDQNYLVYTLTTSSNVVKQYIIVKMEGFFERNKIQIITLNEANYTLYNSCNTSKLSA